MSRKTSLKLDLGLDNTDDLNDNVEYASYGVTIAPPNAIFEADLPHLNRAKTKVKVKKVKGEKSEVLLERERKLKNLRKKLVCYFY